MVCSCADRQAVVDVTARYAACLDGRDWTGLDEVFTSDAVGVYGDAVHEGRDALVRSIAHFLDRCGPSQHLLGNHQVQIDGDVATSICKVRVLHLAQAGAADTTPYEVLGEYVDHLQRTELGWRISHRRFDVRITQGDIRVLFGPGGQKQKELV